MISSIKKVFPNVKIVLGSTITPARYKGANVHVKTRRFKNGMTKYLISV